MKSVLKCTNMPSIGTPGGHTHMLKHTGMCRKNGTIFCKKSLSMGPEKIPNYGSDFRNFPGMQTPRNLKNLVCFCGKIARNRNFFQKNP